MFQTVHVKTGDTVQVIAGSDKGKVGVVSKVLLKTGQVVVEGVNVKVRRKREERSGVFFVVLLTLDDLATQSLNLSPTSTLPPTTTQKKLPDQDRPAQVQGRDGPPRPDRVPDPFVQRDGLLEGETGPVSYRAQDQRRRQESAGAAQDWRGAAVIGGILPHQI